MKTKELFDELIAKGYFHKEGIMYNPKNEEIGYLKNNAYISIKFNKKEISIHRFIAYTKFGDTLFDRNIMVRHKDNNKLNNHPDNLLLGTNQDNRLDIPPEIRRNSQRNRKVFTEDEFNYIHNEYKNGKSQAKLSKELNVSAATLSNMLKRKQYNNRKLTPETIEDIRKDYYINNISNKVISEKYKQHNRSISKILQFLAYNNIPTDIPKYIIEQEIPKIFRDYNKVLKIQKEPDNITTKDIAEKYNLGIQCVCNYRNMRIIYKDTIT